MISMLATVVWPNAPSTALHTATGVVFIAFANEKNQSRRRQNNWLCYTPKGALRAQVRGG